ncbi:hypothetical protein DZ860_08980 [Vibrio sinensis]|uniref:Uncharacterized protein n=1 Tax=Vibrio sinensis TaxID=2302434 RepID=A0A3A6QHG2_9VIBR|nr:hypothetical protein [Vibrio sinensis]RJX71955.1 hypothetical protein DZ860_08980 [Vibrio sinensis]
MAKGIKWLVFAGLVLVAYASAWLKAYQLSESYYQFAQQQFQMGNYTTSLKGMNKLELRKGDTYLGGYQQVIETWEGTLIGPKPDFYYRSQMMPAKVMANLNAKELEEFIQIYVELDTRYVPEVADQVRLLASQNGQNDLFKEMTEFLVEAFPYYQRQDNLE